MRKRKNLKGWKEKGTGWGRRDSTIGVAMSASEDDKRAANFSDIHGF